MQHTLPSIHPETLRGETSAPRTTQVTRPSAGDNTGRTFPVLTYGRGHSNHSVGGLGITGHYSGPASRGEAVTIPARNSFEERQLDLVAQGVISIEHSRQNVERYRELRNASAARLLGGAS